MVYLRRLGIVCPWMYYDNVDEHFDKPVTDKFGASLSGSLPKSHACLLCWQLSRSMVMSQGTRFSVRVWASAESTEAAL